MAFDQKRFEKEALDMLVYCFSRLAEARKENLKVIGASVGSEIRELCGIVEDREVTVAEHVVELFSSIGYEAAEGLYRDEIVFSNLHKPPRIKA